jgi:purine-cytosine permease-like protein/methyl-accepting chemotaxis protein
MNTAMSFKVGTKERGGWLGNAAIWVAELICFPMFMVGGILAGGLSMGGLIAAVFVGYTIVALYTIFLGMQSCDTGLPTSSLAVDSMGVIGAQILTSLPMAIACIGWFGVQSAMCGALFSGILAGATGVQIPVWISTVLWGLVMLVTILGGYKMFVYLTYIAFPILAVIVLYALNAFILKDNGMATIIAYRPQTPMPFSAAIGMAVGSFALAGAIFGDYSRYSQKRSHVVITNLFIVATAIGMYFIGAAGLMAVGNWDMSALLSAGGHPFLALILIVLGTWTTNIINGYSGGVAVSNMLGLDASKFKLTTGIACGIGIILGASGIMDMISGFISVMSSIIPPLAGVLIAAYWIRGKGKERRITAEHEGTQKDDALIEDLNITGIVAFIAGAAVAYLTTSVVPFFIPPINGIIASMLVYMILSEMIPEKSAAVNIGIGAKIGGGFFIGALVTLAVGGIGLNGIVSLTEAINKLGNETAASPEEMKELVTQSIALGKGLTQITIFCMVAGIMMAIGLGFMFSGIILGPIKHAFGLLKGISQGDLTQPIEASSNDELGEMMHLLHETQSGIKTLILAIKDKATTLTEVGAELSTTMIQSAAAIHQISTTTQGMKEKSLHESASVTETNATMGQVVANIDSLNSHIEKQAESVSRSSAAIVQMVANIASVTTSLIDTEKNIKTLADASEKGSAGLYEVSIAIRDVTKASEQLLEINEVIQNIASQTDLLSMNAAIEAAHAGEVGKGFAVVADEIRKLAESSSDQAKTVSSVLKEIKDSLDRISVSTDMVLFHFGAIDTGVKTVSTHEAHIRTAMEEQDAGSKEILETMGRSQDITQNVRRSSEEMLIGSKEVISEGKNLEALTADLTNGMTEIATGMSQINIAVTRVQGISMENRASIEVLVRAITRFKLA